MKRTGWIELIQRAFEEVYQGTSQDSKERSFDLQRSGSTDSGERGVSTSRGSSGSGSAGGGCGGRGGGGRRGGGMSKGGGRR